MVPSREDESNAEFRLGDAVALCGMPANSGLNGAMGILMKPMGRERWVVKVDKDDKTKVVTMKNLTKVGVVQPPVPDVKYSILGTWDEWEPHEMAWNGARGCFEGEVTIGQSGEEDFKFLLDEDWSKCVHPDREKANVWDGHSVEGPDDGGYDSEWTIGRHQNDRTSNGAVFLVQLFVSLDDYRPLQVGWELLTPPPGADAQDSPPPKAAQEEALLSARERHLQRSRQRKECEGQAPPQAETQAPQEQESPVKVERPPDVVTERAESGRATEEPGGPAAAWDLDAGGGFVWKPRERDVPDDGDYKDQEDKVLEKERQARARLEKRLEAAAWAESKALEDRKEEWQEQDHNAQDNYDQQQRELMAKQRHRMQADWKQWNYHQFQSLRAPVAGPKDAPCCTDCWAPLPAGPRETTVCAKCREAYEQICAAGWDASVVTTSGYLAGDHAQWLSETSNLTIGVARQRVMSSFPHRFVSRPPE